MISTADNTCKEGASKSNNDGVCEMVGKLQNMSMVADTALCANCGKEGDKINNICNKCKQVKYCNAVCKKVHKKKHKKDCEEHVRLAAEHTAKLHDIELFKQPPTEEDCPICFLRMPTLHTGSTYMSCCGKMICSGCIYAPLYDDQGNEVDNDKCPFCRTLAPKSDEEGNEREKKRMDVGDAIAIYNLGCYYQEGSYGFPQDRVKALELYHRAGDLGYPKAHCSIGVAYDYGEGVGVDEKKAVHCYELAAMKGNEISRFNLGNGEERAGNMNRALKHYMIAVKCGHAKSLDAIKKMYSNRHATKDDYTTALHTYQEYLSEIKSNQRDEAATFSEQYRYY